MHTHPSWKRQHWRTGVSASLLLCSVALSGQAQSTNAPTSSFAQQQTDKKNTKNKTTNATRKPLAAQPVTAFAPKSGASLFTDSLDYFSGVDRTEGGPSPVASSWAAYASSDAFRLGASDAAPAYAWFYSPFATGQTAPQQPTTPQSPATAQQPATPPAPAEPTSRALPSPIPDPPFPFADWTVNSGMPIGESWDVDPGPLQHALFGKSLDKTHYRITGWLDVGGNVSTSKNSNLPETYDLFPNHFVVDQFVIELQKMPDTVQKRYVDWGFMSAHLGGADYRFTTAAGYLNDQWGKHNNLYGYDPVLQYFLVYFPKIADGAVLQVGRYISPIDIEAQLSNQNYLYSHSLMFGVDPYTYTGINMQVRVNKEFEYYIGAHAGNENSPWSGRASLNGEFLLGWNSADNKDSLWGGLDSIGAGKTIKDHDNEQIMNFVWGHVWTKRFHMQTQAYYMWQYDPIKGGTPSYGPTYPFAGGGGPGAQIHGKAVATGFVNNLEYMVNKNDYITFRSGMLNDPTGWRTGYNNLYCDFTLGYSHLFNKYIWFRPEISFQHAFDNGAFDNGTKKDQFVLSADVIFRF